MASLTHGRSPATMVLSHGMTTRYLAAGHIYTYDELRGPDRTRGRRPFPAETWRDGVFNFDDYLTESLHSGTITVVEDL